VTAKAELVKLAELANVKADAKTQADKIVRTCVPGKSAKPSGIGARGEAAAGKL
jgi:hypothetical protein